MERHRGAAGRRCASALVLLVIGQSWARAEVFSLDVPRFRPAVVVPPRSAGPRPVVVALHGNFDRPEWNCDALPQLVEGRAWLLCIRGVPRNDIPPEWQRYTYGSRARVLAEIEAALAVLRQRFPGRVAEGPLLLAGFSLGAIYGARFAIARPQRLPRLYLVEGSHKLWTAATIERFARGGGKGVLFGCGRRGCGSWSRRLCALFLRRGVSCAEVTVPTLGHSYTAPLPEKALPFFRQLVADDPRWR